MTEDLAFHTKKSKLLPILAAIGIGALLTVIMILGDSDLTQVNVFPESAGGVLAPLYALFTALVFLVIGIVGGLFIVFLLKSEREKLLLRLLMGIFGFTGGVMTFFFSYVFVYSLPIYPAHPFISYLLSTIFLILVIALAVIVGVLLAKSLFSEKSSQFTKNLCLLYLGGGLGAFLGIFLPTWTAMIMLVLFAIWDIYAVKKGPIKEMVEYWDEAEKRLGVREEQKEQGELILEWQIGLGDLVFYTMLTSHVLNLGYGIDPFGSTFFNFLKDFPFPFNTIIPVIPFILVLVGVIIGAEITFRLLMKSGKIMPGLPLSVALGVGLFIISAVLIFFTSLLV